MEAAVVFSRLVQYAAVATVGGASLFFLHGYRPATGTHWPLWLVRTAAGLGAAATIGWLMTQAGSLGDDPRDALVPGKVWAVAVGAGFGVAALVRSGLLVAAFGVSFLRTTAPPWRTLATLGLAASASFAWTGHGNADDGVAGVAHLAADVVHLEAAAIWVGALFSLLLLLVREAARPSGASVAAGAAALAAFSRIGPWVVGALVLSGLVNSMFLIGLAGLPGVLHTSYGRLLTIKLALFGLMLGLATANRYVLTPRLELAAGRAPHDPVDIAPRLSLLAESLLALAVLFIVSWLGTLSPTGEM